MAKSYGGPPLAGGYMVYGVSADLVSNSVATAKIALPPGLKYTVIGVSFGAGDFTSTPVVEVGTAADPNGILVSAVITSTAQYAVPDGALAANSAVELAPGATSNIEVVITAGAAEVATNVSVHLHGFVTAHPTNIGLEAPGRESIEGGGR